MIYFPHHSANRKKQDMGSVTLSVAGIPDSEVSIGARVRESRDAMFGVTIYKIQIDPAATAVNEIERVQKLLQQAKDKKQSLDCRLDDDATDIHLTEPATVERPLDENKRFALRIKGVSEKPDRLPPSFRPRPLPDS